jgi:hypothetical protein
LYIEGVKIAALSTIVLVATLIAWLALSRNAKAGKSGQAMSSSIATGSATKDIYTSLRNQALQSSRKALNLPPASDSTQPWGVLMDWGNTQGTATVVALSDGSASVYLSSGGGFIGGEGHEVIRKAAQRMVSTASETQAQMKATTTYPLPKEGEVVFYSLTDSGVFTAHATEEDLKSGQDSLFKLGNAGQDVISQYRLIQK